MKRFSASALLVLVLAASSAVAGVSPSYINYGLVTRPPVVDATAFVNLGDFDVSLVAATTNLLVGFGAITTGTPYSTRDTTIWSNQNLMIGTPGFRFDQVSATSRTSSSSFFNDGTIIGIDTPGIPFVVGTLGSSTATTAVPFPTYSYPLPSQLLVYATNIVNEGTMEVGSVGLIQMTGKNVNLANGTHLAGSVSENDVNDLTGQEGSFTYEQIGTQGFTVDPPQVYDLWWGATNGETLNLPWTPPFQPGGPIVGVRGYAFLGLIDLPINFNFNNAGNNDLGPFEPFVYEYTAGSPTNVYINMMFVNTNILDTAGNVDTNVTVSAGFLAFGDEFPVDYTAPNTGDFNGIEDVVQFSEPVLDIDTGVIVTNSVYFVDVGALLNPMTTNINTQYTTGYSRPNEFQVYTASPFGVSGIGSFTTGPDIPYDPSLIYSDGDYVNNMVTMTNSSYGVQIGRNPETLDGSFSVGTGEFTEALGAGTFDLPDPTNEPARVEVNADYLNLTNSRFRAEGVVTLNASNVVGSPVGSDWGNVNASLASTTNGTMLVSNVFPSTFTRVRGDIYAWGTDWVNVFTNGVTNTIHYHVVIVDQNIHGAFKSSIRNLSLKATNIVIADTMRVIGSDLFDVANLAVNGPLTLTQNAGNFDSSNSVALRNLEIGTNGSITADGVFDVGYPQTLNQPSQAARKYSILSITNFGTIAATAPLLQAASFENDGAITAANGGSIIINAKTVGLSQAGINETVRSFTNTYIVGQTNSIQAGGSVAISAASVVASNSVIQSGLDGYGALTLNVTSNLTDNVPNTPTTNNVLVNFWQTTGGFSLTTQPTKGSLFGTQIKSIVTDHNVANHVWAGTDYGPTNAAYHNSVVIGRLVLDRLTPSGVMHFTGAGAKSAMYVDFLELDDASYTDYRNGLIIDPNLTIYFADSTADPVKLEQSFPGRLIWVPDFTGPNSTVYVPFAGGGFCLVNGALASSPDISTAGNGIPNADTPIWSICPSGVTTMSVFAAQGTDIPANLVLSVYGQGAITPELKSKAGIVMGGSYSFTAVPQAGWVFDGWTGTYPTEASTVKFTIQPSVTNVTLTANFIHNPFPSIAGTYNGLFLVPEAVTADSSGFFTFKVGATGVLAGSLRIGAATYAFSGEFSAGGAASVTARSGPATLGLTLQLDTSGQSGQVSGNVQGGQWNATLSGDHAPAWTARNPAPQAGKYTMLLPGDATQPNLPAGGAYGTVSVTAAGNLSFVGNLADGVAISQGVAVSKAGMWPLYAYAPGGKDTVMGWMAFAADGSGFGGNVNWFKNAGNGTYYPQGFALQLSAAGDRFTAPPNWTNAVLTLSGGNLSENLTNSLALVKKLTYSSGSRNVTVSVNPATGGFSGSFVWPGTRRTTSINGVILQSENSAGGFFLGTNTSGVVLFQGK